MFPTRFLGPSCYRCLPRQHDKPGSRSKACNAICWGCMCGWRQRYCEDCFPNDANSANICSNTPHKLIPPRLTTRWAARSSAHFRLGHTFHQVLLAPVSATSSNPSLSPVQWFCRMQTVDSEHYPSDICTVNIDKKDLTKVAKIEGMLFL